MKTDKTRTCPFCKEYVLVSELVSEHEIDYNFYCPTYVDVGPNRRWNHFYRALRQFMMYEAIIPPFNIIWEKENRILRVEQFSIDKFGVFEHKLISEHKDKNYDDFINAYYRFEKLKAFS